MASLNPFRPSRAKQCRCKCKSHCLVFNASTELYEGDGKMVSRSTRDNHAKDDKLLATLEQGASQNRTRHDGPSRAPTVQTDTQLDRQRNWIRLCEEEILLLSEFPVSDPMHPLEFANNPSDHGEYIPPTPTELVQPNRGTFALSGSRANTSFLTAEYRLCELATTLSTMERSDEAEALAVRLHEELSFLSQQKAVHWAQQRIHIQPGRIVVNTGDFL
ncbi:hypothetical protein Hypma_008133 [Hypsizygus marmoreus]|uniref:Uncharacterized protein n=1 Tax=Hypsizygus marmoreus TaxID=39966 RepID=A0A369JT65_HYPMA|nr:hypothetical protein Hypma_008133 [Hypsizygus marmoreus]